MLQLILKDRLHRLQFAIKRALDSSKEKEIRLKTEMLLAASEVQYRRLFESIKEGILILNIETGKIIDVNPFLIELLGYSKEELLEKEVWEINSFKNIVANKDKFLELQQKEYVRYKNLPLETSDGRKINVEFVSNIYSVNSHKVVQCNIRDITERKIIEQRIQDNEKLFRAIIDQSPIAIALLDLQGHPIISNLSLSNMVGYSNDELSKMKFTEFTYPEDVDKDMNQFTDLIDGKISKYSMEKRYVHKNGNLVWANLFVAMLRDENGNGQEIIGMAEDITERKLAEEELKESQLLIERIIDAIPVRVFWKDKNLIYLGCNVIFARDAGFTEPKDVIGKDDYQMVWHDQAELYRNDDHHVIESGSSMLNIEEPSKTPEGNFIALLTSKVPLRSSKGEIIGILGTYLDITERKLAEEKANNLAAIVESSEDAIIGKNLDGVITSWNKGAEKIYGYTENEMIGKSISLLVPLKNNNEVPVILEKLKLGEIIDHYETIREKKDGKEIYMSLSISPIKDQEGKIIGASSIGRDITERKRIEEEMKLLIKLQEFLMNMSTTFINLPLETVESNIQVSLKELGSLVDADRVYIMSYDLDNKVASATHEWCNLGIESMFASFQKIPITNIPDLTLKTHLRGEQVLIQDVSTLSPGELRDFIMRMGHKSSISIPLMNADNCLGAIGFHWIKKLHTFSGNEKRLLIVFANMLVNLQQRKRTEEELNKYRDHLVDMVEERTAELKQSQETFRALAENIKDVIIRVNKNFQFLYMNSALQDLFGITTSHYIGKSLSELNFPKNIVNGFETLIKQVFDTTQSQRVEFKLPNGIWADLLAMPEYDINGKVGTVIISARDITEIKKLQLEIQEALKKEKELNELKNNFISMVSHEFRTPLTTVLSSSDFLESAIETMDSQKKSKYFNRIRKNVENMTYMLEEVLFLNKMESEKISVNKEEIYLHQYCKEIFEEISESFPQIKSTLHIKLDRDYFKVDSRLLRKILENLISNAFKYNNENGSVNFRVNSSTDRLRFEIEDTGIGIPEEEKTNVYQSFTRMSNSQNIKGSGLGLSITKKTVDKLGGEISFTSKEKEGTTFIVIIPIN
ncbi:MAG: PAS domain S-box protein [Ignavibacteriales bacterium]|nr:PAS domain S-box protein [Ignavibacteriales bacterium]